MILSHIFTYIHTFPQTINLSHFNENYETFAL